METCLLNQRMKSKIASNLSTEEKYLNILEYYRRYFLAPKNKLEGEIRKYKLLGLSREEAIDKIYRELFGESLSLSKYGKTPSNNLELSLHELREEAGPATLIPFLMFALSIFTFNIVIIMMLWITALITMIVFDWREVTWTFNEKITLKDAYPYKDEIIEKIPKEYQKLILQNLTYDYKGNTMKISFKGEALAKFSDRKGETKVIDLGTFEITVELEELDGNLILDTTYSGITRAKYANIAAVEYEKYVVAFRSAVNESYEKVIESHKMMTFQTLAKMLMEKGVIVKEIKCPRCGAILELPKKGSIIKCSYCGAVIKAVDVYNLLSSLFKAA